jgi:hypothetical protein
MRNCLITQDAGCFDMAEMNNATKECLFFVMHECLFNNSKFSGTSESMTCSTIDTEKDDE